MSSKWNPFNAVAPGGYMVKEVMKEKNKVEMPILSDDQKMAIQERLFEAFNNQEMVNIRYFKGGNMYNIEGFIEKIDQNTRKIIINSDISVFFSQICEIS
jgi:hypothetical protein